MTFFPQTSVKRVLSCVENCLELQNEPHLEVRNYSDVLKCFHRILPKTTIMGGKVAILQISSDLTETSFLRQTCKTGQILQKIVLHLIINHIQLF